MVCIEIIRFTKFKLNRFVPLSECYLAFPFVKETNLNKVSYESYFFNTLNENILLNKLVIF